MSSNFNYILAEITEKVKTATRIEEIIAEDGVTLKPQGKELIGWHSNKHGSESKKSLHVDPVKGLYHCFNCGEGGDVLSWLMHNRGMTFMEAVRYLAARAGIEMPDVSPEEQQRLNERRQEQEQLWALYTAAAEIYHEQLTEEHYELFWSKWGLTAETVDKYKFGFAPGGKFISDKLRKRGFDPELINRSGLVNKGGYDFFQIRLIFTYWKNNKVVNFIGRRIDGVTPDVDWEKAKFKKLPVHDEEDHAFISEAVSNEYFAGEDTARGADELLITEGIADCYAALQAGLPCISPVTVQFRKEDWPKMVMLTKRAKIVYICNDNEINRTGEKGALATAEYLESQGINVRLVHLPRPEGVDKVDLAEYLRDYGADAFRELLKQAKTLLELALDRLAQNPGDAEARAEAIRRIAKLEDVDRDVYASKLYQILKKLDVKKSTLEAAIKKAAKEKLEEQKTEENEDKSSQADELIQIATTETFLFHDETKDGFANLPIDSHRETWHLRSNFFKQWLVRRFYEQTEKSPNSEAFKQALNVIEAKAVFDGPEIKLSLRVAEHEGCIYYDLADDKWRAVKIYPGGWEIVDDPPILFRRYKNTAPQVLPQNGGKLDLLKKYVNLRDEADWLLLFALIVHAFIPGVPHGIPIFYGDKGSAKTTAQRVIRKLIDPAVRDTMTLPADKNELALLLMTNYAPCFDNLDGLKSWQSDMLCQAATGGGISKRELYTNIDEVILSFLRCPMLNGINLVASRDDLLDRSVLFRLDRIAQEQRKTEAEFWREFERDRPYILGAIFDVLSKALQIYPNVKLPALPRMADFAQWGYAIAQAISGNGDDFIKAYYKNIAGAVEEAVTSDVIGAAVIEFMFDKERWEGTATELLEQLSEVPGVNTKEKAWPKRPHTLTRRLNKIKVALADYGINVEASRTEEKRFIAISNNRKKASEASYRQEGRNNGHLEHDASMTHNDACDAKASCQEAPKNEHSDAINANDAFLGNFKKGKEEIEVWEV